MALTDSAFTFGERVGLVLLAETSAVSACAIIGLLSYIAYSVVCITPGSSRRWRLGGPAEVYFLNQLAWDLVQAIGGLMNIKWAADASVRSGSYCSAQGAIKQMSDVGSAISTLLISLYTIRVLCFWKTGHGDRRENTENEPKSKLGLNHSFVAVACLWLTLGLLVTINIAANGVHHFYGPTGFWCWIRAEYSVQRTATDFAFMWTTTLCNIVIYGILFLNFRGYITTDGRHLQVLQNPETFNTFASIRQAYGLLFYPLVYTITILPISIVRYRTFAHHSVSFPVLCFVDAIYLSLGLLNVLLFSFTRPYLLPHDPPIPDVILRSPLSNAVVGTFRCEAVNEGPGTQSPEWYGFPRTDSPISYCDAARVVSVPVVSTHGGLSVKTGSLHSLGV